MPKAKPAATGATEANVVREPIAGQIAQLKHAQILPDPLNPRRDFETAEAIEALDELAEDIAGHGLLQNLIVRPAALGDDFAPLYRLIGGERRWRAVGRLIAAGRWAPERTLAALVIETDDLGHRLRALAENLQRKDLKPLEEARAFKGLIDAGVKTAELAAAVSVSQRQVQMRLCLLNLDEGQQAMLEAGHISVEQARNIATRPKPEPLVLNDAEALLLVEIADKLEVAPRRKGSYNAQTEIAHDARSKALSSLIGKRIISVELDRYGNGRNYASFGYSHAHLDWLREHAPSLKGEGRDKALLAIRSKAVGEAQAQAAAEAHRYVTAFLNGPFALSQAMAKAQAERKADRKVIKADERAKKEKAQQLATRAGELVGALAAEAPPRAEIRELLQQLGAPLPWRVEASGALCHAQSTWGMSLGYGANKALTGLLAALVNAAGGVADAPEEAGAEAEQLDLEDALPKAEPAPAAPERDEFSRQLREAVADDSAEAAA